MIKEKQEEVAKTERAGRARLKEGIWVVQCEGLEYRVFGGAFTFGCPHGVLCRGRDENRRVKFTLHNEVADVTGFA